MNTLHLILACFAGIFVLAVGAGVMLHRLSDEMDAVLGDDQDVGTRDG